MEGLCELARVSGLPAQDLSRLSPGSAISAMQIRQSMEDGVLIPWKKNRPEDMKTATQMLFADRGGLYLDPFAESISATLSIFEGRETPTVRTSTGPASS